MDMCVRVVWIRRSFGCTVAYTCDVSVYCRVHAVRSWQSSNITSSIICVITSALSPSAAAAATTRASTGQTNNKHFFLAYAVDSVQPLSCEVWSGAVAYLGFGKGGRHGERAEREPITGVWERSPQRGPGAELLVGGWGGEAPLKLKHFFAFERSMEAAHFMKFGNAENHRYLRCFSKK